METNAPFKARYRLTAPGQFRRIHDLSLSKETIVTILRIDAAEVTLDVHQPDKFSVPGLEFVEKVAD